MELSNEARLKRFSFGSVLAELSIVEKVALTEKPENDNSTTAVYEAQ